MEKLHRSQVAKGVFLLILLLFAPFISSSSLRTSYLYFLLNILIVALGIEAGFLKAISRPHDEVKKQHLISNSKAAAAAAPVTGRQASAADNSIATTDSTAKPRDSALQKVASVRAQAKKPLKRCSSKPSLFFIGGWEGESASASASVIKEEDEEEKEEEKDEAHQGTELSKQELFAKAEAFIGNFYMQLKMQREESWKKIHGLYQRAF